MHQKTDPKTLLSINIWIMAENSFNIKQKAYQYSLPALCIICLFSSQKYIDIFKLYGLKISENITNE